MTELHVVCTDILRNSANICYRAKLQRSKAMLLLYSNWTTDQHWAGKWGLTLYNVGFMTASSPVYTASTHASLQI